MVRILAAASAAALVSLVLLPTTASAGKSRQGFEGYHKRQQQARAKQHRFSVRAPRSSIGSPMSFDNDGRVRNGGAMPEFSRLPFRAEGRSHRYRAARARSPHRTGVARHGARERVAEAITTSSAPSGDPLITNARRYVGGNPTGWTHQWCGVFMRMIMRAAGFPDPSDGNLARNWAHYGRPSSPRPGAIVVWSHHVALITAVHPNGTAVIISGNDYGRKVRERPRSIAGAIAIRAPG